MRARYPTGLLLAAVLLAASCSREKETGPPPALVHSDPAAREATFVGSENCRACHEEAFAAWRGSHHQLAMQPATGETVLGDFDNTTFAYYGTKSRFFRRDGKFYVNTEGPDGRLHDYEIAFTFGVTPLQQYLVPFPDGRYQALGVAWDTRPREAGGQRWFHLYPGEHIRSDDELHWTAPDQNWNNMCAECHSTNLEKKYDAAADAYRTTWSEISVGCEACHGAGSAHVEWAEAKARGDVPARFLAMGLQVRLGDLSGGTWSFRPDEPTAARSTAWRADTQIETCARCHSRRTTVATSYVHGRPFMDTHLPSLLEDPLYYVDGQIRDEVYEFASFRQSRMYHQGVACTNCHEPHSGALRAPGDAVCAQCHDPAVFAAKTHHFHETATAGASCIACHMPEHTYMVVDPRRDHSMRVPRPDLSIGLGTPSACTMSCHVDSTRWAADSARAWWPKLVARPHFGSVLSTGRSGSPAAETVLARFVMDARQPAVARATAVELLVTNPTSDALGALRAAAADPDPLLRRAAAAAADEIAVSLRIEIIGSLLDDPILTVRAEAARALVPLLSARLEPALRGKLLAVLDEYIAMQLANQDRAFAHLNLGNLYRRTGDVVSAEREYRVAIDMEPRFTPAAVNLADLYLAQDRDDKGETVLLAAARAYPKAADVHRALGLLHARQRRSDAALADFKRARELRPDDTSISYAYALALNDLDRGNDAIAVLEGALRIEPYNRFILYSLATIHRDRKENEAALGYARRLAELAPGDPRLAALIRELSGETP